MLAQNLVQQILEIGLSGGADFAEIFLEDKLNNRLTFIDNQVDRPVSGRDYGLGLRLIKDDNTVYAFTNEVTPNRLLRMAEQAAQAFRAQPDRQVLDFTRPDPRDLSPVSQTPNDIDLKTKVDLMRQGYQAAKDYDPLISQAEVTYLDHDQHVLIANSEGLWVEDRRVRTRYMVSAVATRGSERQTGFDGFGASMGFEMFEQTDVGAIARESARIAKTMVLADYAPSGMMPIVMDNAFGGVLFHEACGHGLEATFVSKDSSVYAGKMGQTIASELVTAIDDGTIPFAWGTLNYDDEGTPTQRNVLIEKGVLKSYLVDRVSGKRMNAASTGSARRESYKIAPNSRMNNTYINAGESTREEIIADTEYGLYAKKLGGGSVDVVTGEFNFAVMEGYLIENGKITRPVRGASLIGTGLEVLQKIDRVGKELVLGQGMCGAGSGMVQTCVGQPPLRIKSLTVGGR